jgi:hypothetical protein
LCEVWSAIRLAHYETIFKMVLGLIFRYYIILWLCSFYHQTPERLLRLDSLAMMRPLLSRRNIVGVPATA